MSQTKAVILAAGLGTRLKPLTDRVPKCLVPIGGRPLMDYWLDLLAECGVCEALLNTHALADQVRRYINQVNRRGPVRLVESHEPELLGSAGTIAANPDFPEGADHVLIIYADNLSDVNLRAMLEFHRWHGDPMTMLLFRAPNPRACGIAELDEQGRIVGFAEKPAQPRSDLANAGVYAVDAGTYRRIAAMDRFDFGHDVLPTLVGQMRGWMWTGYHLDVGTPQAYERAQKDVATAVFQGCVTVAKGLKPAVFFDRDGTLIEQVHYLSEPGQVKLLPGVAEAIRQLQQGGYACVAITNQSAIGRGMISESDLQRIHAELHRQLAAARARLDGVYHCPVVPRMDDRTVVEHPDRKPGPGMLLRAARELGLELKASWMVGDMISDVATGRNARCRGSILVQSGKGLSAEDRQAGVGLEYQVLPDVPAVARWILSQDRAAGRLHAAGLVDG